MFGFIPDDVIFDPDLWILSGNNVVTESGEPIRDDKLFSIFPNPAFDQLSISYQIPCTSGCDLEITNITGQVVKVIHQHHFKAIKKL
jgi:hypothetical protein